MVICLAKYCLGKRGFKFGVEMAYRKWRIGKDYGRPWLPMRLPESPTSICDILDKNERVSLLIKGAYNLWDVDLVRALFSPWVARVIFFIPLPPRPKQD